jgi:pyridoxine 5-phosphate synthase
MANNLRLGINIDHVATLRNARGGDHPCPIRAAHIAKEAGADGITVHLREDRRHIRDNDIERLKNEVDLPLNLEMAMTEDMMAIALRIKPHAVCLVPEKRAELTTEGGLDALKLEKALKPFVKTLQDNGSRVSLFIDPVTEQVEAARRTGAHAVELHTGTYAEEYSSLRGATGNDAIQNTKKLDCFASLAMTAKLANSLGLEVHAGHGLNYDNVGPIAAIPEIVELNIGHFLIGEALFVGLKESIQKIHRLMKTARSVNRASHEPATAVLHREVSKPSGKH